MSSNERFVLTLATMACCFGLAVVFLPDTKAALYAPIPGGLVNGALTYLGNNKNGANQSDEDS